MGKTTDNYVWQIKILVATKLTILSQTCAAGRASNIELLMLVLDFVVNSRLKILNDISVESTEYLNEDA